MLANEMGDCSLEGVGGLWGFAGGGKQGDAVYLLTFRMGAFDSSEKAAGKKVRRFEGKKVGG